ncbi:MAG: aminotransferase class I/II-fold pyridoxal phosphate-dependent enzyme [Pseudomonadota bacterium]
MELLARAKALQALGHDVIHLEVGEPDFETPPPIVQAGIDALRTGATKYTDAGGIPELRQAISRYYADQHDVQVSPSRIFVTAGASGGLLLLTALLLNERENLLMTDPGYPCNRHFLSAFNAEGLLVPVTEEDNYQLNPSLVDQFWNEHTRGVLIATPANPTGSVLTRMELGDLSKSVQAKNGLLIVDEIYQGLVYENQLRCTALGVDDNAFIVNSFSKYFGMTGWRLGWVVVPHAYEKDLEKLAQNLFICPSTIAQTAALSAFSDDAIAVMEQQRTEFANRRNFLVPKLRAIGFDVPQMPAGAFYVYAKLPSSIDSETFCRRLLEKEYVAITPGTDFGFHSAEQFVRISYARNIEQLNEAVLRIERHLNQ